MLGPRIIFFFWLGLGLFVLGLTFYFWSDTQSFLAKAVPTTGTVLQMEESDDGGTYAPVVGFQTLTGQKIEYHSNTSTNPPAYRVGDKVNVLYDPAKSSNVRINDFISLWLLVLILGIMGSIFTAIGVLGLVFAVPMRHRVGVFAGPKQAGASVSSSWSSDGKNHSTDSNKNHSTNSSSSKNHSTNSSSKNHSANNSNKNRSTSNSSKNHSTSNSSSDSSSSDSSVSWGIDTNTDSSTSATFSWSSHNSNSNSSSDFSAGGASSDWGSSSSSDFSAGGGSSDWGNSDSSSSDSGGSDSGGSDSGGSSD
jgi:hypothetical protein